MKDLIDHVLDRAAQARTQSNMTKVAICMYSNARKNTFNFEIREKNTIR